MEQLKKAKAYIDALTVDSPVNIPEKIVPDPDGFFTWDNEKRSKNNGQPYLYQWSYYNGVVFEGLKYVWEATGEKRYWDYGNAYMQALTKGGAPVETAGYVPYHGLDCYKTAALLLSFSDGEQSDCYLTAKKLYDDLTQVNACYTEPGIGGNYWHSWAKGKAPKYKVWLDGLYMGQPFLAEFAARIGDQEQLDKIAARFAWVRAHLRCPQNGIFYHAGDDQASVRFSGRAQSAGMRWRRSTSWTI
jgi:unsaturated rhamnogalacturonyl hydrolase